MPIRVYYEVLNQKGTPALYSDNYAQRPAAGYVGRIFYSPDTAQIFYDTGSTWTLLADAGVGSGSLASVCANGNTTATGIIITAGGLSTNSLTSTNLTAGSIPFIGTGGLFSQDNTNLFWDNTNKYFGINTNTPSTYLDVHGSNNVQVQINNTTTADSKIAFLNAGVGKWRIGNLYSGGSNLFHIYNNAGSTLAMQINSSNAALFYGSLSSNSFISAASGITLTNGGTTTTAGATNIGGLTAGLSIALASGFNQTLTFPTGVAYTYTFPSATGTLLTATSFTTNVIPKYNSTAGTLTASMLSDDGTTLTSSGATRSNLYLKAANNTYYSQLAFTNGSNSLYGGFSYNTANQWLQFETNTSEWMRLLSNGNFGINTTSPNGKLQVKVATDANFYLTNYNAGEVAVQFVNDANSLQCKVQFYASQYVFAGGGNVGIGQNGASSIVRLVITGVDSTSSNYCFIGTNNSGSTLLSVRNDGLISTGSQALSPYNLTFGGSANLYVNSLGELYRATSSLKYKTDVFDYDKGLDIIKKLRPVYYKGKNDINTQYAGFIAEEVHEIGLTEFVQYADDETPDALNYANMTALLTKGIQQIDDRLTALENKLN